MITEQVSLWGTQDSKDSHRGQSRRNTMRFTLGVKPEQALRGVRVHCLDAFSDLMSYYVERIQPIGFCSILYTSSFGVRMDIF